MKDLREEVATALRYKPKEDRAPVIVATGKGLRAQKIKEVAEDAGIPVYRDKTLANALHDLGIGREIPTELYDAVAKILVHVSGLDKNYKNRI